MWRNLLRWLFFWCTHSIFLKQDDPGATLSPPRPHTGEGLGNVAMQRNQPTYRFWKVGEFWSLDFSQSHLPSGVGVIVYSTLVVCPTETGLTRFSEKSG